MKIQRRLAFAGGLLLAVGAACVLDYDALRPADRGGGGDTTTPTGGVTVTPPVSGSGGEGSGGVGGSGTSGSGGTTGAGGTAGNGGQGGAAGGGTGIGGAGGGIGPGGRGGGMGGAGGGAAGSGGIIAGTGGGTAGNGGASGMGGATTGTGGTGPGTGGRTGTGGSTGTDPDLVVWYAFESYSGASVPDSANFPGGPRNGQTAVSGMGGRIVASNQSRVGNGAVELVPNGNKGGGLIVVPDVSKVVPGAFTIACWVNVTKHQRYQRIFDFGSSTTSYMFLTPQQANDNVRFGITSAGLTKEERIETKASLTAGRWHHVAVVVTGGSPATGTVYVDGAAAGRNDAITLHLSDLGNRQQNFLGMSHFAADPFFAGRLDSFRIYRRALTAAEVMALATGSN